MKQQLSDNEYKVFVLEDVARQGNIDILISPNLDTLRKYIPDGSYPSAINAVLLQRNDSNFLFDTGIGQKLIQNLDSQGVKPTDVSKIFITHCHGDHIGGLLQNGEAVFPNAQLYMNRVEYDYWLKEQNALFLQVIDKYKNQLQLFDIENNAENKPLCEDIFAVAAYGHTPGHTMYLVGKGENQTLIWGDLTHVMPIQMPHPEYSVSYDFDAKQAADTRQQVLNFAADKNINVIGMHIPGGIGKVTKNENGGYIFENLK